MKRKFIRNAVIAVALCTALIVPAVASGERVQLISARDNDIIPISYKFEHWSEQYLEQLSVNFDIASVFENKNLGDAAKLEDFKNLVKLILDKDYNGTPDAMTREAVVHELTKMWADKTGQDLDEIAVIKMIIYSDTEQIDSKYNHSVTVAYMKNIAIGRGDSVFNPKDCVTYGELATLLSNIVKAIETELKSDNEGIVKGSFETRGNYTIQDGKKIIFDFELMSHYTKPKTLQFASGQQFEVVITDEKGEEVYRYSDGRFFTLALVSKIINAGEAFKWQDEWDLTNKKGEKLTSGKFRAEISIMVITEKKDEIIEEKELTAVINFSLNNIVP